VAPKGSDSLGVSANLLASLMVDGNVKSAIAHRASLQPSQLVGVSDASVEPAPVSAPPGRGSFILTTHVVTNTDGGQLPIIEINAQAPNRVGAARLAAAAVAGLHDYLDSKAALTQVPDADRLQVTGLGAPQATTQVKGPSNAIAIVVVIFVFALGCGAILGSVALARGWRAAAAREQLGGDQLLVDDVATDDPLFDFDEDDEQPAPAPAADPGPRRAAGPTDNWLAATPRPALVVPPPDESPSLEHDAPQAQSA
jgi:hypothetical protein